MKYLAILLIGLMTMTSTANAQDNRILNLQSQTSAQGIDFWHVEDHSLPIITMHFAFRGVGSITDPIDKIGLGQLVSNTLDEGAGERDAHVFQEALQDHAIDLSFSNSRDHFVGKLKTLKRHSDLAFELLYDSLHTPKFDDEAINRMRASNITRIKSSVAKPQWMGARLMNETYFEGHPYARNSGGTISGLQAITGDDMHAFVKDNFVRDRLVVAVAGNLDMIEASNLVDKIFADLPAKGIERDVPANVTKITNPRKKSFAMPSPQSAVQMVWQTNIDKNHPDYYAYRVMNYILGGGGFSSMLMDEIREKQGLTYGIYSHPVFMNFDNYLAVESATSPENIAPMTASIHAILDDIKTNLVDAEILSDAKSYLIGSLPLRFASTLSLSGAAIRMQLDGRNINALDEWDDKINKVTAADIMRVANQIFDNNDADATVISGAVPDDLEGFDAVTKIDGIE